MTTKLEEIKITFAEFQKVVEEVKLLPEEARLEALIYNLDHEFRMREYAKSRYGVDTMELQERLHYLQEVKA
tara:strand:- start:195 stop:410 length:216 start_codon:yes stop_codon:yes gene_type:complete